MNALSHAKTKLSQARDRMLNACYYKFLFGREFPLGPQLAARFGAWERNYSNGDTPVPRAVWERQYQSGMWSYLRQTSELARYCVIVGYLTQLKPGAAVLDIGCGEGILFSRYRVHGYSRYIGIDISAAALTKLLPEQDTQTTFICADAENYVPDETFDAIIFNESLYYFHEPLAAVARYMRALRPTGVIIISTYAGSLRARSILRAIKSKYSLLDEVHITHAALSWTCSVFTTGENPHG